MVGDEYSPGWIERLFLRIPEGTVLNGLFYALLALLLSVLGFDYYGLAASDIDASRVERTEPMPLELPKPGDQIRPFLPKTVPVGPNRGEPRLPGYDGPVEGAAMGRPMEFRLAEGDVATAVGRIDMGTAAKLRAFLDGDGKAAKMLVLHSPGGSVEDALEMARLVREKRLETQVPADGYCASACPLVLAGGIRRAAGQDAWVGLHQVYAVDIPGVPKLRDLDRSVSDIQATVGRCQELLVEMGVAPAIWIKAMRTPPQDLYVLTPEEMRQANLTTKPLQGPPMPSGPVSQG
ncbi:COG3904 family protein [Aureimonas psammosilenae]|uniref:COG3904 family protein n=1 Tax=Aureimonas psammosilenae TaxID=2495496 RepID=UPI0012605F03|nr:hypothetical protein [Aureimonas psammosilenae]